MIIIKMTIIKDDNNGNNKCNNIDIVIRITVTIVYIVRKDRLLSDFLRHSRTVRCVVHLELNAKRRFASLMKKKGKRKKRKGERDVYTFVFRCTHYPFVIEYNSK